MKVFLDSNIPMYVAGAEHPNRAPARRLLDRVRSGAVEACTSTDVLQEILSRYVGLERLDLAREVYNLFVEICPAILGVTLADTDLARDLMCGTPGLAARNAVHGAVMINHGIEKIATFDKGFDRIEGISRVRML